VLLLVMLGLSYGGILSSVLIDWGFVSSEFVLEANLEDSNHVLAESFTVWARYIFSF